MRYLLFFLLPFIFTSCYEIQETDLKQTKEIVLSTSYSPPTSEDGYHYGWSVMRGKYCYHYGTYTTDAKYNSVFTFMEGTLNWNSSDLYEHTNHGDTIIICYTDKYKVTEKSRTFIDHDIKTIITQDTVLNY